MSISFLSSNIEISDETYTIKLLYIDLLTRIIMLSNGLAMFDYISM